MGKAKSMVLAVSASFLLTVIPLSAANSAANKTNKEWVQAGAISGKIAMVIPDKKLVVVKTSDGAMYDMDVNSGTKIESGGQTVALTGSRSGHERQCLGEIQCGAPGRYCADNPNQRMKELNLLCRLRESPISRYWRLVGIASAASLSPTDKQFMISAAKTDMTEAHEGQMAENQGRSDDVKNLAKTLVQDHTNSYTQLSELAAKEGVSIPKGINASRDPSIRLLVHLTGQRFDQAFTKDEITERAADYRRVQARSGARQGCRSEGLRHQNDYPFSKNTCSLPRPAPRQSIVNSGRLFRRRASHHV